MTEAADATEATPPIVDPRALLASWANEHDEWARFVVGEVIATGSPLQSSVIDDAYNLFRQEKALDDRTLPVVPHLSTDATIDETAPTLLITKLSEVHGVNALVPGGVIEPHEALTILYGENGTGKTGYARIFKALAESRTVEEILSDVNAETRESPTAKLEYKVGDEPEKLEWAGERGVSPFTRMSIFDSRSVSYHVDDDLDYVYTPAALSLFNYINTAIRGVETLIDARLAELQSSSSTLLSRFPRESSVYAEIETLGASTDLEALKAKADPDPKIEDRLAALRLAVAALEGNTISAQIRVRQTETSVLTRAGEIVKALIAFEGDRYNELLLKRTQLTTDRDGLRSELFAAANLPEEPDETWSTFVQAGEDYRRHLADAGVHDADRCLYCRQPLDDTARDLLAKYSAYLEDKISADLTATSTELRTMAEGIRDLVHPEVRSFLSDHASSTDKPNFYDALASVDGSRAALWETIKEAAAWEGDLTGIVTLGATLSESLTATTKNLEELQAQAADRATALSEKKTELNELTAAGELARSWSAIETRVENAKEADRLTTLKRRVSPLRRQVTELSKTASDELINRSFDTLFAEECEALRAPALKVQFVGREGRPQRRKVLTADHRPSRILSEGEQKVLAMADFLAEARLAGITAPVIFDDPVSSLDHRRAKEVAQRIAGLTETTQVIVFTHDILFTSALLRLFEISRRCNYFHITDESGKGLVTRGGNPTLEPMKKARAEINKTIEAAAQLEGVARTELVRVGYSWIRSWCEVFTEMELLQGVSQRYAPNIRMGTLRNIKTAKLSEISEVVLAVFDDACSYTESHSQPLETLGAAPTLEGLKADWEKLKECKKLHDADDETA